jgi:hypothetical protein
MLTLLKQIFPPVLKYNKKLPHEWTLPPDVAMDPYRPLEHGEDGCAEPKTFILRLDAERHGRVVIRQAELS